MPTVSKHGGTFADDSTVGTTTWTNPSNAGASDDAKATASLAAGVISHYLKATNFGFSIPTGSIILGITIAVECKGGIIGGQIGAHDQTFRIVKGGTIGSTDGSSGTEWGSIVDTIISHGSATDLWGDTWTAADINGSTFGVAISAKSNDDTVTAAIDDIIITIDYISPTGFFPWFRF